MSNPRTLVSGGTGFVGRFIVEALLSAGHDIVVAGRHEPEPGFFSSCVGFVPLDLGGTTDARALFTGADFFVHAAFDHVAGRYRGGEGNDPDAFRHRNLDGSKALFEAAKTAGVRRVVFLSSRAVYGAQPSGGALSEDAVPHPDTLYGEVKLAAEKALEAMTDDGFASSSLRVTGVYGPAGPGRTHKWQKLFSDYQSGKPVPPRAGTEVHGRDVGEAVSLVLTARTPDIAGRAFNVSDVAVDRRDILRAVQAATGVEHALPAAAGMPDNVMVTESLRALGWRPGGMALLNETVSALADKTAAFRPQAGACRAKAGSGFAITTCEKTRT